MQSSHLHSRNIPGTPSKGGKKTSTGSINQIQEYKHTVMGLLYVLRQACNDHKKKRIRMKNR